MSLKPRYCLICRMTFAPDHRAPGQKVCSRKACQRERKRRTWRRSSARRRNKRRIALWNWAQGRPAYWRDWRKNNSDYRQREIKRMRGKRACLRRVAKPIQIRRLYVERLKALKAWRPDQKNVAKPTQIARRLEDLVECLIWRANVAKPIEIEVGTAPGR